MQRSCHTSGYKPGVRKATGFDTVFLIVSEELSRIYKPDFPCCVSKSSAVILDLGYCLEDKCLKEQPILLVLDSSNLNALWMSGWLVSS